MISAKFWLNGRQLVPQELARRRIAYTFAVKNDQHVVLDSRPLRDLYVTLMNDVFDLGIEEFGENLTGAPPVKIAELIET